MSFGDRENDAMQRLINEHYDRIDRERRERLNAERWTLELHTDLDLLARVG